jgi:acyl-coenzyme A synthetase/AMP-(fatty) acid ligase
VALRPGDVTWADFLASGESNAPGFEPHVADPDEITNVLFSSGTTGVAQCIIVPSLQYCELCCKLH